MYVNPDAIVKITVGDKEYQLYYNNRALRELEKKLGKPISEIKGSITDLTMLVWAGLKILQPQLSEEEVDDIISHNPTEIFNKAVEALKKAGYLEQTGQT